MIHTLVSVPVAFVVNLLVARVLDPTGYGRLAFLTTVMEIATGVLTVGLMSGVIQFGAKAHADGRPQEVRHLLSASQGFRLIVAAPALTVLVLVLVQVDPWLLGVALLFGIWIPAGMGGATACLQLENKTAWDAKITLVSGLVVQVFVLAALYTVGTPDAVWAARIMLGGLTVPLALIPIARGYRRAVLRPRLPRGFPPGFWRFAIPAGAAALVATLVVSRTEVLFLQWLASASAVGVFALAFGVANHLFAPARALIGPLVPAISGLREVDESAVAAAFGRTLRASSTIVALLCAIALPPLAALVPVLYGEAFAASAPLVVVLGVSMGFLVAAGPVSAFVLARLSARRILTANLSALVVDLALAISLIPVLGVWGAVLANVAGSSSRLGILLVDEVRHLQLSWPELLRYVIPLGMGALACTVGWLIVSTSPSGPTVDAVLAGGAGTVLLFGGLKVTRSGLTPQDSAVISRVLSPRLQPVARPFLTLVTIRPRRSDA